LLQPTGHLFQCLVNGRDALALRRVAARAAVSAWLVSRRLRSADL